VSRFPDRSVPRAARPLSLLALVTTLTLAGGFAPDVHAQTRLLRFPAIHGDRVAFTYGGDLWTAPVDGGTATRLTAHPGLELFARFSPDGRWIAFTGQYDGDEQVYVIASTGGEPRQLTFYPARGPLATRWGYDHQVYGWTPDGKSVVFRSHRHSWTLAATRLYTVAAEGGPAVPLPMPDSGAGDFAPDGTRVVYSPLFRDFRSEKRYAGGQARPASRTTRAPIATPCGSGTRSTSRPIAAARSTSTHTTSAAARPRRSRAARRGTSAGRAPTARAGSSTS
jgi:tricorn protease